MELPINEIRLIIEIIRAGQLGERHEEFFNAALAVLTFALRFAYGDLGGQERQPIVAGAPQQINTDADALDTLEHLTGESDGRQRALSLPPEIWAGLARWLFDRIIEAIGRRGK